MPIRIELPKKFTSKVFILSLSILLMSCGFSSKQELVLSKAVGDFVDAVNNNDAIKILGMYHPLVVKHHTKRNIDSLKTAMETSERYIVNYRKEEILNSEGNYLVKYSYPKEKAKEHFYAFSKDGANSWVFVEEADKHLIAAFKKFNN